jgi:hypothetical protein
MYTSTATFSSQAITYGDIIYSKSFMAFNGYNNSISAKIVVSADPDGVIRAGTDNFTGSVPGKIQFFTANDNGKLQWGGEFDKSGRLLTGDHMIITRNPSGYPLVLILNTDEPGNSASLSLRRSRGTLTEPTTVKKNDSIFKISWHAHDGQSYKEVSSICSNIEGNVFLGNIPASIIFKTFDPTSGVPTNSVIISPDKSVSIKSLSSIDNNASILLNSPITLPKYKDEVERDSIISNPALGTLIFLINLDTIQVYTKKLGWKNLC